MSNLHVVLSYEPFTSTLVAELYDQNNQPNSESPNPFIILATYRFYSNNELINEIVNGDRVEFAIPRPECATEYRVIVTFIIDDIIQSGSTASIVVGGDFIYGEFIRQKTIPGGVLLELVPPPGLVAPINIIWAHNYQIFSPLADTFIAPGNGIYEVAFQNFFTGLSYYSAIEVTQSSPEMYIKIVGNDGNIYGTFGTPQSVDNLLFLTVGAQEPITYKLYVNGTQISDNPFLSLSLLEAGDLIYFYATDCCGIVLTADTFILPCGTPPSFPVPQRNAISFKTREKNSFTDFHIGRHANRGIINDDANNRIINNDTNNNRIKHIPTTIIPAPFPRPDKSKRPLPLPLPPKPRL